MQLVVTAWLMAGEKDCVLKANQAVTNQAELGTPHKPPTEHNMALQVTLYFGHRYAHLPVEEMSSSTISAGDL